MENLKTTDSGVAIESEPVINSLKPCINEKEVEYFGQKLLVKESTKYMAINYGGSVYAFANEPMRNNKVKMFVQNKEIAEKVGTADLADNEDWHKTLREV